MTLREITLRAVQWAALSALFRGILQFVQLTVLARLLLPADFGLAVTCAAIVSVGSVVADLGLNSAYLQAVDIDKEERSALFFLNLFSGFCLTLLFIAIGPFVAYLVGDQRISPLLQIYSHIFVISALGLQLRYDAEKRLDFRPVAIVEIGATTLGVGVAVFGAWTGNGAASVIYGTLTTVATNTVLLWLFLSNGWRPQLRVRLGRARRFLKFGLAVLGNGLVTQLSTNLDMMIGVRLIGTSQFGLYAAPRNLFLQVLSLINPIVTRVGFPLVAHLQNDRERVARFYRKTLETIIGISAPIYLGSAVFAEPIVTIVLGERWIDSVSAFRMLALWALCRSVMNPLGNLLLGMGRPGLGLKWNLAQSALALAVLPIASSSGGSGLAAAVLGLMLAQLLPAWYFIVRPLCGMSLGEYLSSILRPAVVSLASVGLAALLVRDVTSAALTLALAVLAVGTIHLAVSWVLGETWLNLVFDQLGIKLYRAGK